MTNVFKEWTEAFTENQKQHERKLALEEQLYNWECQSGYDEYRWHAILSGLPFRRAYR